MLACFTALLAIATVGVVAVTIDPTQCYTLTTGGVQDYLDSASSVLDVENHPDRQALIDQNDKGVRFQFPNGEGGPVVNQAHNDHFVGLSGSSWRTDVNGNAGGRASVSSSGSGSSKVGPLLSGRTGKQIPMPSFGSSTRLSVLTWIDEESRTRSRGSSRGI